jgi:hypothetical protein
MALDCRECYYGSSLALHVSVTLAGRFEDAGAKTQAASLLRSSGLADRFEDALARPESACACSDPASTGPALGIGGARQSYATTSVCICAQRWQDVFLPGLVRLLIVLL